MVIISFKTLMTQEFIVETDGYYVIKIVQYEFDEKTFRYNDILIKDGLEIKKLNRFVVGGNTPTVNYLIDPAIPADNYESTDEEFTDDILATLNEHGVSITALEGLKLSIEDLDSAVADLLGNSESDVYLQLDQVLGGLALRVDGTNKMEADIDLDGNGLKNVSEITSQGQLSIDGNIDMNGGDIGGVTEISASLIETSGLDATGITVKNISAKSGNIEIADNVDMEGNQIKNVADAVVDDDAINLGQLKAYVTVEDTTW